MTSLSAGTYIQKKSFLHQLDARTKLLCLIFLIFCILTTQSIFSWIFVTIVLVIILILSQLSLQTLFSPVLRIKFFIIIIFLMNALFYKGSHNIISLCIFHISKEGILSGLYVILKFIFIILIGNILTCTTMPMALTHAFEWLISPLHIFHLPVREIAMMLSISLQFIPLLMEETEKIRIAQIARGARFESKNIHERIICTLSLLVPVFLTAFKRADELATAMESRGYQTNRKQTYKRKIPLYIKDKLIILVCILATILQIYIR